MESYPIDYPFSDSTDVTVVSLRELAAGQGLCLEGDASPNLLFHSDDLWHGSHRSDVALAAEAEWTRSGCAEYPAMGELCRSRRRAARMLSCRALLEHSAQQ